MTYKYLIENIANRNIDIKTCKNNILYYLCYHITDDDNNPFIQIMLEKTPFTNNLFEEEFLLPSLIINNNIDVEQILIPKIKNNLEKIGCNVSYLTNECYLGIIENNYEFNYDNRIALINISTININNLEFNRNSPIWFTIPTEIVNNKMICNIPINNKVIELFVNNFSTLGLLYNKYSNKLFPIPDILYSFNDYKQSKLENLLGRTKKYIENKGGYYLHFCRNFQYIIKMLVNETDYGLNRYIYFIKTYKTMNIAEFSKLTILELDRILKNYKIINIQYENTDNIEFDIIINNNELIQPLALHKLTNV
jgi:hypothetical protein